jgi:hypothetical protein
MSSSTGIHLALLDDPHFDLVSLWRSAEVLVARCRGVSEATVDARFTGVRGIRIVSTRWLAELRAIGLDSPLIFSLITGVDRGSDKASRQDVLLYVFRDTDERVCLEVLATGCEIT